MKTAQFEARYLDVQWRGPGAVTRVSASVEPLLILEEAGTWKMDAHVFNGYQSRIGFRILDKTLAHPPYFIVGHGVHEDLFPIVDPATSDTWWIESSGWDAGRQRHNSRLQRTVGEAVVCVQGVQVTIRNHSLNFTVDELDAFLGDFKSDLWALIFSPGGTVRGKVEKGVPNVLGQDLFQALLEFAGAAEKIAAHLEVALAEVVEKRPLRAVRPLGKTFVELAVRSHARQLSSRGFVESPDTPANRYVHYLLRRLLFMIEQLEQMALRQKADASRLAEERAAWSADIASRTHVPVSQEVFHSELAKLEHELERDLDAFDKLSQGAGHRSFAKEDLHTYTFLLGKNLKENGADFFCSELDSLNFKDTYGTYCVVTLPEHIAAYLVSRAAQSRQNSRNRIRVTGWLSKSQDVSSQGKKFFRMRFRHVEKIELLGPFAAHQMRDRLEDLSKNGWQTLLTPKEKQERNKEAKALAAKARLFAARAEQLDKNLAELRSFRQRLRKLGRLFSGRQIGTSATFPTSMTFVRNPHYCAAKAAHDRIQELSGIEDDLMNSMMAVEDIGLVNVSNLYEKWCLLQVIKVLRDGFGFEPQADWKRILVDGVLGRSYDIALTFHGLAEWTARLVYEKVLANGRRPDFVLELSTPYYERDEASEAVTWFEGGRESVYLVLDAKFRERWRPGELSRLLEELCTEKDYSAEGQDAVFILHPCQDPGTPRTSPLAWGQSSDYGQADQHKRGAIYLSPRHGIVSSIDNLQRLFGMVFQQASHFLAGADSWMWTDALCIGCGKPVDGRDVKLKQTSTKAGKARWEIHCHDCELLTVKTNCFNCGRDIFKNGYHWTYHRTRAESQANIVCPGCECFFDEAVAARA
jgi:hypothetical protein